MNLWKFTRSPASVNLMLDFGREAGLASSELLHGSRLSEQQLAEPNVDITAAQEVRVIKNLLHLTKAGPSLGLLIGRHHLPPVYGIWGLGLISCATLGDAMTHALRFLPLTYAFSQISSGVDGGLAYLQFYEADLDVELKTFLVNRDMAASLSLLKAVMGSDVPLGKVTLRQPVSRNSSKLREFTELFGVEPVYSDSQNSLAFDQRWLARPLPLANPTASLMCQQVCNELLEKRRAKLGTAAIVRQYLGWQVNHIPNLNEMAVLLNTSERTLKRLLQREGTSFRDLVMQHQRDQAFEYLQDGRLSIADIATRLGFSDSSSFSQSFKRWTGEAPLHFRLKFLAFYCSGPVKY